MNAPILATIETQNTRQLNDNANPEVLPVGTTREIGSVRFHRYNGNLEVTDLANAGKRGKVCRRISVTSKDGWARILETDAVNFIIETAELIPTFSTVENAARLVAVVTEREKRGVDVTPAGHDIRITGLKVDVTFSPRDFSISDSLDFANESRAIHFEDYGANNAKRAHKWALANRETIAEMSFEGILRALSAVGVKYHRYCGMD